MKERIQQFIDYKGITPGDLAEVLGVQRSNISHILNGRNKPGAVFIEKFLQAFPHVNARWLFTGEEPMVMDGQSGPDKTDELPELKSEPAMPYETKNKPAGHHSKKDTGRVLERVVLLYSDGTFVSYNPA